MTQAKLYEEVHGLRMAYVDQGPSEGDAGPVVFLHGNPTSSYLWRNVIPHIADRRRCIAPDLIGMGDSDKLPASGPDSYTFAEHRRYLDALLEQLSITRDVTLVLHDWGSGLGFDWARRHPDALTGICFMEAICGPLASDGWPEAAQSIFQGFRSEAGEDLILERNFFVERVLPSSIMRTLTDEEMAEYRRPFAEPGEGRRPTLSWPRQIPFDGEPADVHEAIVAYRDWLRTSDIPKLYIHAEPGFLSTVFAHECRTWPNLTDTAVPGIHFIQEDSPDEIGVALSDWLR